MTDTQALFTYRFRQSEFVRTIKSFIDEKS